MPDIHSGTLLDSRWDRLGALHVDKATLAQLFLSCLDASVTDLHLTGVASYYRKQSPAASQVLLSCSSKPYAGACSMYSALGGHFRTSVSWAHIWPLICPSLPLQRSPPFSWDISPCIDSRLHHRRQKGHASSM
jgi:hypothetical protein